MTNMPTNESLTSTEISTAQFKSAIGNLRSFITQLPGGNVTETLTITGNKIVPSRALVTIQLGEGQTTGSLDLVSMNNLPEGSVIILSIENPSIRINVRHDFGGIGSMLLFQGKNILMDSTVDITLVRVGNNWVQRTFAGYLFNDDGLVKNELLNTSSESMMGILKLATEDEFIASSSTTATSPIRVKEALTILDSKTTDAINELNDAVSSKMSDLSENKADINLENTEPSPSFMQKIGDYSGPDYDNGEVVSGVIEKSGYVAWKHGKIIDNYSYGQILNSSGDVVIQFGAGGATQISYGGGAPCQVYPGMSVRVSGAGSPYFVFYPHKVSQ